MITNCPSPQVFLFLMLILTMSHLPRWAHGHELLVLGPKEITQLPLRPQESIGLEKKGIVQIKEKGAALSLQAEKPGSVLLRVGTKTIFVVVATEEQWTTYHKLKVFLSLAPKLSLDFKEECFVVKGPLDHPSTWLNLAQQNLSHFRMDVEATEDQIHLIEYFLNKELTKFHFSPIKIQREPQPTVRWPNLSASPQQALELIRHFGLRIKEDSKRIATEPLIRVQVLLVEIRKSFQQTMGLEWPYQESIKILPSGLFPLAEGLTLNAQFFEKNGKGRILAQPLLLTKSGSTAEFFAGGEFPIKMQSRQSHSVSWKRYGITLKIKPLADPDGRISLDLSSEVSSIDSGEKSEGVPSLFTNTISSHFDLNQSQTLTLSGLMKKIDGESLKRWPGLGEIPILGSLFTSRDYQEDKTELLVFVTPTIVEPQ